MGITRYRQRYRRGSRQPFLPIAIKEAFTFLGVAGHGEGTRFHPAQAATTLRDWPDVCIKERFASLRIGGPGEGEGGLRIEIRSRLEPLRQELGALEGMARVIEGRDPIP